MGIQHQLRPRLLEPEALEVGPNLVFANGAAKLAVVVFSDAFPDRVLSVEVEDELDAFSIAGDAISGVRGIAQEHVSGLDRRISASASNASTRRTRAVIVCAVSVMDSLSAHQGSLMNCPVR